MVIHDLHDNCGRRHDLGHFQSYCLQPRMGPSSYKLRWSSIQSFWLIPNLDEVKRETHWLIKPSVTFDEHQTCWISRFLITDLYLTSWILLILLELRQLLQGTSPAPLGSPGLPWAPQDAQTCCRLAAPWPGCPTWAWTTAGAAWRSWNEEELAIEDDHV